jgi:hypothetical protein
MSSTLKHLRSSTASKRPTASGLADGQIGINTASGTPALFFKDSNGGVVKVGPAHVGSTAPNAVPAGSAGNSLGELWVNNGTTIPGLNYYTGSAFVNLTPSGTTTVAGLVELATDAETQTGTDTVRVVTPSGLQSKISDSTSTTSSTTIASATAVKAAYDLADAALPKAGGRVTGDLEIGPTGSLSFEGSTDNSFETTLAVVDPTADRTITFPNVTGTVVTTGDSGTVTSTMILDGTIVNADINASAGIVDTKLATIATAGKVSNSATTATNANTASAIVARDASGNFSAGTITANLTGTASAIADNTVTSAKIVDGTIVNADINASAAIAGTKISPNFGSQALTTTGLISANGKVSFPLGTAALPSLYPGTDTNTGIYSPGADQVAISTNGVERVEFGTGEVVFNDGGANYDFRIEGDTNANLFFVDASTDRVGIGDTAPDALLTVNGVGSFGAGSASAPSIAARGDLNTGMFFPAADTIAFAEGGSEAMRIDSSSRLLVGTSTARTNLYHFATVTSKHLVEVASGSTIEYLGIRNANDTNGANLGLGKSRGTSVGSNTLVLSGDVLGQIDFFGSDGFEFVQGALIRAEVDGTPRANEMPGRLVFSTTDDFGSIPTQRMRIGQNGYVKASNRGAYNDTAGAYHELRSNTLSYRVVRIENTNNTSGAGTIESSLGSNGNNTSSFHFTGNTAGTNRIRIYGNGNIQNTNNSYGSLSDFKLKENIVDANSQWNDIKALQVRNYNLKEGQTHTQIGLIAQEVELVSPGLVTESPDLDEDGNDLGTVTKSVNYSVLYMKAVKALQEAMERIEVLEQRLSDAGIA